jgi:hypothetical protein
MLSLSPLTFSYLVVDLMFGTLDLTNLLAHHCQILLQILRLRPLGPLGALGPFTWPNEKPMIAVRTGRFFNVLARFCWGPKLRGLGVGEGRPVRPPPSEATQRDGVAASHPCRK